MSTIAEFQENISPPKKKCFLLSCSTFYGFFIQKSPGEAAAKRWLSKLSFLANPSWMVVFFMTIVKP